MPRVPTEQSVFIGSPTVVPDESAIVASGVAALAGQVQELVAEFAIERADARRRQELSEHLFELEEELQDKRQEESISDPVTGMRGRFDDFASNRIQLRAQTIENTAVREMFTQKALERAAAISIDVGQDEFGRESTVAKDKLKKQGESRVRRILASTDEDEKEALRRQHEEDVELSLYLGPEQKQAEIDEFRLTEDEAQAQRWLRDAPRALLALETNPDLLPNLSPEVRERFVTSAEAAIDAEIRERDARAAKEQKELEEGLVRALVRLRMQNPSPAVMQAAIEAALPELGTVQARTWMNELQEMQRPEAEVIDVELENDIANWLALDNDAEAMRLLLDPGAPKRLGSKWSVLMSQVGQPNALRNPHLREIASAFTPPDFATEVDRELLQQQRREARDLFNFRTTGAQPGVPAVTDPQKLIEIREQVIDEVRGRQAGTSFQTQQRPYGFEDSAEPVTEKMLKISRARLADDLRNDRISNETAREKEAILDSLLAEFHRIQRLKRPVR